MDDKRRKIRFGSGTTLKNIQQIISRRKSGYEVRANKRAVNLDKMIFTSVDIGKYFDYKPSTLKPQIDILLKKKCITIEDLPPKPKLQRLSCRLETTKLACITQCSERPMSQSIIHSGLMSALNPSSCRASVSLPVSRRRSLVPATATLVVKSVRKMKDNQNQGKRFRRYAELKEDSKKKL